MTFRDDDGVVPELRVSIEGGDEKGHYVKLSEGLDESDGRREEAENEEEEAEVESDSSPPSSCRRRRSVWFWIKLVLLFACLGGLAVVFLKWVGPFFMDKELIPIIKWEMRTFTHPICGLLVFASVALFPTLLLPSSPSMWVAGMTFGYGYGFLLIFSAVSIGVSLPYFIGHLFRHKIQGWLERYPEKAAILRAAGEGNWFHQFRAVTLIRISPFPYILYNYCAVATRVKYSPYILGSLLGMVPEIFVAIYTGILIRTLSEASAAEQHGLTVPQIILNILGFLATVATTILFTTYAKRQLKILRKEEEPLLQ